MKKLFGALLALVSSVAFATTTVPVQLLNPTGSSSGQTIVSTGASSAPGWAPVPLSGLSSIAANTVLANATSSSAAPTAFAMPSCSTVASALQYTTNTGFTCLALLTAGNPASFSTIAASGLISPTSTVGIKGTTTNDSPATGSIGESNAPGTAASAVATTSAAPTNVTSVSLTAGDYLVWGMVSTNPAGGTITSGFVAGVSTTSAGYTSIGGVTNVVAMNYTTAAGQGLAAQAPMYHLKLSTTTTVYLVTTVTYSTSTLTTSGVLNWIRIR